MSSVAARLQDILTELRLPTVKRIWAARAKQSNKEGWPAERFLVTVMEHELAERETRRLDGTDLNLGCCLANCSLTSISRRYPVYQKRISPR
jgi:hypothetical protein